MKLKLFGLAIIICLVFPIIGHAENERNVYYYILVDRFESGDSSQKGINLDNPNGFHGGDFKGIEFRKDHLKKIGVTHVILSPVFKSSSYTGFNVDSYEMIQNTFGTEQQLVELIESLNSSGIEVILHFPIDENLNDEQLIKYMELWNSNLPISGYYFSNIDQESMKFWSKVNENIEGLMIGEADENPMELLEVGFDRVVDRTSRDEAVNYFKHFDQSVNPLVESTNWDHPQIINLMDHYDTDRFTHVFANTGSHPITHWKLALTYLLTTRNEALLYHGSEIPLDGIKENQSHHQMVNFLAGDDQLIKHMEKITNAYNDLPPLSQGKFELLHAEDSFLVYQRTYQEETTIVAINNSSTLQNFDVSLPSGLELRGTLIDDLVRENNEGTYTIGLERESSNIFIVQEDQGIYWPLVLVFAGVMSIFVIFVIIFYRKNKQNV